MSINDLSPYWGNGHQSEPTESYDAYSHVPTVTQDQWSLNSLEALAPGLVTPSVSKNAAMPSLQCSSTTASTEGHGDRTNVVATDMSQDPTTMSQRGSALADDERSIWRFEEELREDQDRRMEFVWNAIGSIVWGTWTMTCGCGSTAMKSGLPSMKSLIAEDSSQMIGSMLSQPCVVASLCSDIRLRLQGTKKCAVPHPNSAFPPSPG
ncbi:hypothetical protein EDD17DRAFT_1007084 [Pisolithus thermaeus]|nr:hypothetical protein EDD17DRAFT_1007084 [Pisolithus thermaeus]